MVKLSPSVLSADFANLGKDCKEVLEAGADMIHFDVMDGHFVDNISFGLPVLRALRSSFPEAYFDVHLMITNPLKYIKEFVKAGASCISFHVEAESDIRATIDSIRSYGCGAGLVVNPDTPSETMFPYLKDLTIALVMGVVPGHGGQAFREEALDKIKKLRDECTRQKVAPYISVDGGVKLETTAPLCVKQVATLLVAGSAVFEASDKSHIIKSFKSL